MTSNSRNNVIAKLQRRHKAYVRKTKTQGHEQMAVDRMKLIGCLMVEKIEDQYYPIKKVSKLDWLCRIGGRKLHGDVRGIIPGAAVLCEVKTTQDAVLKWGAFKKHQREALETYHQTGNVPLIGWYCEPHARLLMIRYRPELIGLRRVLQYEVAEGLTMERPEDLVSEG